MDPDLPFDGISVRVSAPGSFSRKL